MYKGSVWALAAIMALSAAAHGQEDSSRARKKKGGRPVAVFSPAEGKVVGAEYDKENGKIKITILTDSWCNAVSAKLLSTISGRATFGPFHYNLILGKRSMKGCIPNIEKEKVVTVDAPDFQNYAQIVIHGEGESSASLALNEGVFKNTVADAGESDDTGQAVTYEELQDFARGEAESNTGTSGTR